MDVAELQRALDEAKKHCIPRAIVVINPGNPTGMLHIVFFRKFTLLHSQYAMLVSSLEAFR